MSNKPIVIGSVLPLEMRNTSIYEIYQDETGVLWVGTQSGLVRYDGHSVSEYGPSESERFRLPSNEIRAISEDDFGNLLVGTFGSGLFRLNLSSDVGQLIEKVETLDAQYIKAITKSEDGALWVSADKAVYRLSSTSARLMQWELLPHSESDVSTAIPIAGFQKDKLIAGVRDRLYIIDSTKAKLREVRLSDERLRDGFEVTAIEKLDSNHIAFATNTGQIARFNFQSLSVDLVSNIDNHRTHIFDIRVHLGRVFLATDRGVFSSDSSLREAFRKEAVSQSLLSSDVFTLYTVDNYLLVGTLAGLDVLAFTSIVLNDKDSNVSRDVQAFEEDSEGNLWVGTYDGLFIRSKVDEYHLRVGSNFLPEVVLSDQRISSLEFIGDRLWVGFFAGGLQTLRLGKGWENAIADEVSPYWSVIDLQADPGTDRIWVATLNHGLISIDSGNIVSYLNSGLLSRKTVTSILSLSSGIFLVACVDDLYIYNSTNEVFRRLELSFDGLEGNPVIYSTYRLTSGDVWIGTSSQGIFVWNETNFEANEVSLIRPKGSYEYRGRAIYGIVQDDFGNVWLSTNKGLIQVDKEAKVLRQLTLSDGLQHSDFSLGASFRASDGRIYFGGPGGYNVIDPKRFTNEPSPPQTRITSVRFTTSTHHPAMRLTDDTIVKLTHKDRFVTFDFSVMDFFASGSSQYKYKLDGFDDDWTSSGFDHSATYTNLPAGDYRFSVIGRNSAGLWDPVGASVNLTVFPPPWLTPWAFALYGITFVLVLWVFHRVYYSYVIDRRARQMLQDMYDVEMRAEEDLQEQIEYQDEVVKAAYQNKRENLDLIGAILAGLRAERENRNNPPHQSADEKVLELLALIEDHVQYSPEGPRINLHEFLDQVVPDLMRLSPVDASTIVMVNELPSEPLPTHTSAPLAIIAFELTKNCFEHAFDPDSPANFIVVRLREAGSEGAGSICFQLSVSDSGIGYTDEGGTASGGLAIIRSIVDMLSGSIKFDMEDGTTVVVSIPERFHD